MATSPWLHYHSYLYIAVLLQLSLNLDTSITFVHITKSYLVVGCKHTGYKSLMAGLGTEWIYDAFAGTSSSIYITFFFTRLYELTNLVLTL
jgi:hypothetical protein